MNFLFIGYKSANKGWGIVKKLIKAYPGESFTIIGSKRYKCRNNAEYVPNTDKINFLYQTTDILLVPSQWNEFYGRVVAEARKMGVPMIIASNAAGLTETRPNVLVDDYKNVDAWIKAIDEAMIKLMREYQKKLTYT